MKQRKDYERESPPCSRTPATADVTIGQVTVVGIVRPYGRPDVEPDVAIIGEINGGLGTVAFILASAEAADHVIARLIAARNELWPHK